ncbi:MAG: hypothetical protein AAGD14_12820 [Planctomycetota bacterium]
MHVPLPPLPSYGPPDEGALRSWMEALIDDQPSTRRQARERIAELIERGDADPGLAAALAAMLATAPEGRAEAALGAVLALEEYAERTDARDLVFDAFRREDLIALLGRATVAESVPLRRAILWTGWGPLGASELAPLLRALEEAESGEVRLAILRGAEQIVTSDEESCERHLFAHLERRIGVDPSLDVRQEATAMLRRLGGAPVRGEPHLPWASPDLPPAPGAVAAWVDALRWGYGEPEDRFADAIDPKPATLPTWILKAIAQVGSVLRDQRVAESERSLVVLDGLAESAMHATRDDAAARTAVEFAFEPLHERIIQLIDADGYGVSSLASMLVGRLAPRSQRMVDALTDRMLRDREREEHEADTDQRIRAAASILATDPRLDRGPFLDLMQERMRVDTRPRIRIAAAWACLRVPREDLTEEAITCLLDALPGGDARAALEAARATHGFVGLDSRRRVRAFQAALARVLRPMTAQIVVDAGLVAVPEDDAGRAVLLVAVRDCDAFWSDDGARPDRIADYREYLLATHGLPTDRGEFAERIAPREDPLPVWRRAIDTLPNEDSIRLLESGFRRHATGVAHVEAAHMLIDRMHERPAVADVIGELLLGLRARSRDVRTVVEERLPWSELSRLLVLAHPSPLAPGASSPLTDLFLVDRVFDGDAARAMQDFLRPDGALAWQAWGVEALGELHRAHPGAPRAETLAQLTRVARGGTDRSLRGRAASWVTRLDERAPVSDGSWSALIGALRSDDELRRRAAGYELTKRAGVMPDSIGSYLARIDSLVETLRLAEGGDRMDALVPLAATLAWVDRIEEPFAGLTESLTACVPHLIRSVRGERADELDVALEAIETIRPPDAELVDALVVRLGHAANAGTKDRIRAVLRALATTHPELGAGSFEAWAEVRCMETDDPFERVRAVRDWISGTVGRVPDRAADLLVAACGSGSPALARAAASATEGLALGSENDRQRIFPRALREVRDPVAAATLVSVLAAADLDLPDADESASARTLLRAVLACDAYWLQGARPHARAGLPRERADLRRFLEDES